MELLDVIKIGGPAILSFFAGRLQASANNKAVRLKEIRQKLTEMIRKVAVDSISYHATRGTENEIARSNAMIQQQLHQIRTDIQLLKTVLNPDPATKFALSEYTIVHDSITEYPFSPKEMPLEIDANRSLRITRSCEKLVQKINQI